MEHDFIESDVFDTPVKFIENYPKIVEKEVENEIRNYIQYKFGLVFNKQEMIKMFQLYNNRLTADDIQYLIHAIALAEYKWGFETDLQKKLLRLMEVMEND